MKPGLTTRILTQLLVVASIALVGAAVVNYHQRRTFVLPDDGVRWTDAAGGPRALEVAPGGPGERAGIEPGDELRRIGGLAIGDRVDVARALDRVGVWGRASYELVRAGTAFQAELIVEPRGLEQPLVYYFQWLLAITYLTIGAFVFARRSARPMVRHFYVFCLASFVLYAFSYSGELTGLDRFIYWGDVWATLLAPAIFLHFCLVFPRARLVSASRLRAVKWAYAPAAGLLALHHLIAAGTVDTGWPLVDMREVLDRVEYALLGIYFLSGAAVLRFRVGIAGGTGKRHPTPAAQMARSRDIGERRPLRGVLCRALRGRLDDRTQPKPGRLYAGADPADLRLCHRALPPDGC